MSVTGMVDFTNACKKAGVKPIIGCRIRLVDDPAWRKPPRKEGKAKAPPEYFVTWYVLSEAGLKALYRLLSLANDEAHFYNNAKVSFVEFYAALDKLTKDDVAIALTSAYSVVSHPDAAKIAREIVARLSASNAFVELSPIDTPYFDTMNKRSIELGIELELPFLVTRPVCYPQGGADALEVMGAVYTNTRMSEIWHKTPAQRDLWARTEQEMIRDCVAAAKRLKQRYECSYAGPSFVGGLESTIKLVDMVKFEWTKEPVSLPKMAEDEFEAVKAKCIAGWQKRFTTTIFGHRPSAEELKTVYQPRLIYELGVLKKLNFSGYFLLTEDVVSNAKANGMYVGPGRVASMRISCYYYK